jgi:hypothetical protein
MAVGIRVWSRIKGRAAGVCLWEIVERCVLLGGVVGDHVFFVEKGVGRHVRAERNVVGHSRCECLKVL